MDNGKTFEINEREFLLQKRPDGRLQLTSVHPYDATQYHWAVYIGNGEWRVYRCGRYCMTIGSRFTPLSPEQAAAKLLSFDRLENLEPHILSN